MSFSLDKSQRNQPQILIDSSLSENQIQPVTQKQTPQFEAFEIKRPMFNFSFSRSLGSRFRSVIKKQIRALSKQNNNNDQIQELNKLVEYTKDHLAKVNTYLRYNKANAKAAGKKADILESIINKRKNEEHINNFTNQELELMGTTKGIEINLNTKKVRITASIVTDEIKNLRKIQNQFNDAKKIEKEFKKAFAKPKNTSRISLINSIKCLNDDIYSLVQTHEHTAQKTIWQLQKQEISNPTKIKAYENLIKFMKSAKTTEEYKKVVEILYSLNENTSNETFNLIANQNIQQNLNNILESLKTSNDQTDQKNKYPPTQDINTDTHNPENNEPKKELNQTPNSSITDINTINSKGFDENTFNRFPLLKDIHAFSKAIASKNENAWLQKNNKILNDDINNNSTINEFGKFDEFISVYCLFFYNQTEHNFNSLLGIYHNVVKENPINSGDKSIQKTTTPTTTELEDTPKKEEEENNTSPIEKITPNLNEEPEISDITLNPQTSITPPTTELEDTPKKEEDENNTSPIEKITPNLNEEPEISDITLNPQTSITPPTTELEDTPKKEEDENNAAIKENLTTSKETNPIQQSTELNTEPKVSLKEEEDKNNTPSQDDFKKSSNKAVETMQKVKKGIEEFGNQTKKTFQGTAEKTEEFFKKGVETTTTAIQNGLDGTKNFFKSITNGIKKFSRNTTNDNDELK